MKHKLMTVEDTFQISGRGLVVVPGPRVRDFPKARGSMPVELCKPDGSTAEAVLSVSWMCVDPPPQELRWACIFNSLSKEEVPIGTEIWEEVPSEASAEPLRNEVV